jgi:L-ascorbate metabolism protein UlaG (beta-lactamase superfamily)
MKLTWLDSNSWLIEIAQKRILLDPWLVGPLVFGNLPWLFKGEKRVKRAIPDNIDLILLSQGLEDHSHPPTLEKLDHQLPVIASPNGAKVCENLGYTNITTLKHSESFKLNQQIEIKAVPGSMVGFNLVENGYIIRDLTNDESIYYEPHGFHSPLLKEEPPVKVIITPLVGLKIPFLGSVINGKKEALEVCKWLKPEAILPTANGGDIDFEGVLINLLKMEGTMDDFRNLLTENNLNIQVIEPKPGELVEIK